MIKKITLLGILTLGFFFGINSQVIVSEGFEGSSSSFLWQNASGNTTNFTVDTVLFHGGTKSVLNTYVNNATDTLYQTGVVDLTSATNPQLIFWHICKLEGGFDDGTVYISTDSGLTYTVLPGTAYLGTSAGTDGYATAGHFDEDSYSLWGTAAGTPTNSWWQRESFSLAAYSSFTKVKIMFVLESDGSVLRHGWNIDDVSIESVPCPIPTGLTSFGTTSDSTNVTWVANATDTLWQVEYDSAGFIFGTGTRTLFTTDDTVGIGGLLPNSTYDFYVRAICTGGDTSSWQGPQKIYTQCVTLSAPYSQDFDLMTTSTVAFSCYTNDDLSDCWSNDLTSTNMWAVLSGATGSGSTGPTTDHTLTSSGSGKYIYLESSSCNGITSTAFSPVLDITTLTNPQLSFYYHMYGTDMGTLDVFVSNDNGATWSASLLNVTGDQGNVWKEGIVSLVSYIGDTIQIKFEGTTGTGFTSDMALDDILVDDVPTCPKPTGLTNYTLFSDSVDLTWINGAADSTWIIEYGTTGFSLGTGTTVNSTNDSVPVGGLTPNTTYDVYLRSFCDVADTSLWVGPFTFTTPCASYTPPYTEDFTTYTFAVNPTCWDEADGLLTVASSLTYGTSQWTNDDFGNVFGNSNSARMNIWSTGREEWLISPSIDLGTGTIPYQVEFDVALTPFSGSAATTFDPDDKFYLIISTDNGVTWSDTNILEKWDTGNTPSPTGNYFAYNLTAAGYTGLVKFGLYAESSVSGADNNVFVDNFSVVQVPTCPRPLSLTFDSATQTTANLSWTNGAADSIWLLEYGPVGFTQGTGTVVTSTTSPGSISGLTHSTCYDVYMRSVCTVGDSSKWIGPAKVCTDCAPVVDLCEDFETTNAGEIPICWETLVVTTGSSSVETSNFGGNFAPKCIRMASGSDGAATLFLISPEMTALNAGTHRASFWLDAGFSGDTALVMGTMSDPTDPITFIPWDTITDMSNGYKQYRIPFDAYTGTATRIAFLYNPTNTFNTISIDDFCFEAIPSCEKAPSVTILNAGVDSNKINLGWNQDTTWLSEPLKYQKKFIITYGPAGFTPGDATVIDTLYTATTIPPAVPNNFKAVTGLTPLTEYCFWVKSICQNGDTSAWTGPICGSTGCPSSTPIPYTEDFTSYTFTYPDGLPLCWEEAQGLYTSGSAPAIQSSQWAPDGFGNVGTTGSARMEIWSTNRNEWIISPSINLGTTAGRHIRIEYDVAATIWNTTAPAIFGEDDSLMFMISRDNGVSWTNTGILEVYDTGNIPSATGDHIVIDLPNETGVVKFAFYAASRISNQDNNVYIDNFYVYDSTFVGLAEIAEIANFKIYPNPNTGLFTIQNEGGASKKTSIKVVDVQGRLVYDDNYYFNANGSKVVDIKTLKAGVYVLLLQSEGKLEQHRIIISK